MLRAAAADDTAPQIVRFAGARYLTPAFAVAVTAGLVAVGERGGAYYGNVVLLTFLSVILALSLRLLMLAGEASLCQGGFYALGAYTVGILTAHHGFSFWEALPLGGLVAAVGALVIGVPSFRTSGAYFFLMTFGALIVLTSVLQYWTSLTGGFSGISLIGGPSGITSVSDWYFLTLALLLVIVGIFLLFERSRWGLELRAVGDSRPLAQSIGVSPFLTMLAAFAVGAFFSGIAGGFYASYVTFVSPTSFTFWLSTYVLMYVVIGGTRFFLGAIVGTALLSLLPVVGSWSQNYVSIFVAGLTLAIFMVAPRGIVTTAISSLGRVGVRPRPLVRLADAPAEAAPPAAGRPPSSGETLLEVDGVGKHFGGLAALASVDLAVRAGETLGIIGPNGAGKTTLFNIISGFMRPSRGRVILEGRPVARTAPSRVVSRGLTRTFQASAVFDRLTVLENVLVALRGSARNVLAHALVPVRFDRVSLARAREVVTSFGLVSYADQEAGTLPYGVRKRLGVAVAMATSPRLLCLDEPMAGLTDPEVDEMTKLLAELKQQHDVTIVLIEHRLAAIMALCDRVVALDFGKVIAEGTPREVARDPAVVEAYLGGELEEAAHG